MAEEQQEIPQEKYVSLGSKETVITLNDVSISSTKKGEYKTIYLFGNKITVECSSLESNETAMPLVNGPISPAKEADEDLKTTHKEDDSVCVDLSFDIPRNPNLNSKVTCPGNETAMPYVNVPISPAKVADEDLKTHKEDDSVSLDLSLAISGSPNLYSKVTCAGINKDLTEDVRKTKKMRSLPKEEREEEMQTGQWTIKKALFMSDVNTNSRLTVEKKDAESHIIRHLSADAQKKIQEGIGVKVKAYDDDMGTEHVLIFKRLVDSSKSYIFNGDWAREFVRRRELKKGDTIGLFWDNADSKLHFSVLQRKT